MLCIQCRVCTVRERPAGGEVGYDEGSREEIARGVGKRSIRG